MFMVLCSAGTELSVSIYAYMCVVTLWKLVWGVDYGVWCGWYEKLGSVSNCVWDNVCGGLCAVVCKGVICVADEGVWCVM